MEQLGKSVRKRILNASRPYLAKLLRDERPLASNWRLDKTPRPAVKTFDHYSAEAIAKRTARFKEQVIRSDMRRPYRILSLDGGGVRGLITSTILKRIVEHDPDFLDEVDFICGTSAGGLLTLLYVYFIYNI